MGTELVIFGILATLTLIGGFVRVFHHKTKPVSEKTETALGLISLFLATWAVVELLRIGGLL